MLTAVVLALIITMALALARAVIGPTTFDRILAANMFGTKVVLFVAVYGFFTDRPEFLDIAMVYSLINFIGTVAVMKYVGYSHLGSGPETQDAEGNDA
ncbi:monovalent cation/H+ antiporter complex subunit F [Magnetococcales bacterium HHB-1]